MMGKLIYLACPYSDPDKKVKAARFDAANKAAGKLMKDGAFVFSPISHTHPISVVSDLPGHWEYWEAYDRVMLARCSELIVLCLDGWKESVGVQAEIKIAKENNLPVEYLLILEVGEA